MEEPTLGVKPIFKFTPLVICTLYDRENIAFAHDQVILSFD